MKKTSSVLLAVALAMFGAPLIGGEGHNHEAAIEAAPHGGILRDAAPYKAELVLNGSNAKIYLYRKTGEKLVPAKVSVKTLKGMVKFPKQTKQTPIEFANKDDHFETNIAGIDKVHRFDMHVKLPEAGKEIVLDFGIDNIH